MTCEKVDMIETPAILDMKWSLTKARSDSEGADAARRLLGVANAKGQISLHRLKHTTGISTEQGCNR